MSRLQSLQSAGVSIWLDTLSRELLDSGAFARLVAESAVTGATSNPTIFANAITGSDRYDAQLHELADEAVADLREAFFSLALDDVRRAAQLLSPVYERSGGRDGFVSFECTPDLAHDAEGTIAQALELWKRLRAPNAMIKVPATPAGLGAIERLTRVGVNVNVTLLFSVARYEQVIDAYLRGLEARARDGERLGHVASVASFFVSRIDVKADPQLAPDSPLRGRVAIANARVAYQLYLRSLTDERWEALRRRGARAQRPLWASTGTKDPAYRDVVYVEELIGPDVVNTMPEATLRAFADHGHVARTVDGDPSEAERTLAQAAAAGIDLARVTAQLEGAGVQAFCASYRTLLDCIQSKLSRIGRATVAIETPPALTSATPAASWDPETPR